MRRRIDGRTDIAHYIKITSLNLVIYRPSNDQFKFGRPIQIDYENDPCIYGSYKPIIYRGLVMGQNSRSIIRFSQTNDQICIELAKSSLIKKSSRKKS